MTKLGTTDFIVGSIDLIVRCKFSKVEIDKLHYIYIDKKSY